MNSMSLKDKFEAMGARLKVGELQSSSWQRLNDAASFTVDIRADKRGRDGVDLSRFLCGHDERQWSVAAVPGSASSAREAMAALKPEVVRESQTCHKVKANRRNKRKNDGFIRWGEWSFVPCPDMEVNGLLALKNEPLRRGRAKSGKIAGCRTCCIRPSTRTKAGT